MAIISNSESFVKSFMARFDPSHDWYHVDRVRNIALYIASNPSSRKPCDLEIVELAALFHDVADAKYVSPDGPNKTGGEIVTDFLAGFGYDTEKAALVARVVDNIGFSKELRWKETDDGDVNRWREECAELHAVQDADKLDAMGAFGILRCAAFSGARSRALHVPNDATHEQYERQDHQTTGSAINHFHEKLLILKSYMRTSIGKQMANERDAYMREFLRQIEREFKMGDACAESNNNVPLFSTVIDFVQRIFFGK